MNQQTQADFGFDNTFARELEGFFVPWKGAEVPDAQMIRFNHGLAKQLNLDPQLLDSPLGASIFSGSVAPDDADVLAQAYAGHQFGGFSAQLGDGRAVLLGEIVDCDGIRRDIQLKGSGKTPFSRGGDGKAALGPVLREYIMCEAMYALGVPTTRALAAVSTGEPVYRETALPGAVFTRVAESHIRVGTFQYFAARGELDKVRQLADYSIKRHYPDCLDQDSPYLALLDKVARKQAYLISRWMLVGLVHGVMNTDNMTISGETIDYGPCAFIDRFDQNALFSSIDHQGRYAYRNQPPIAQWNLARFAECLLPLITDDKDEAVEQGTAVINRFADYYLQYWMEGMRSKLGLNREMEEDLGLFRELLKIMEEEELDYTLTFRSLGDLLQGDRSLYETLVGDRKRLDLWLEQWFARLDLKGRDRESIGKGMNRVNPFYIPRNHKVEEALKSAVEEDDFFLFERIIEVLEHPFDPTEGNYDYSQPAPEDFGPYRTFCGT